jgi:hypothetical protein
MIDPPSIRRLCNESRDWCCHSGLTPVQWRWSLSAWQQFKLEIAPIMAASSPKLKSDPALPPGCVGVYENLPIYLMRGVAQSAVACIGAKLPVPPLF